MKLQVVYPVVVPVYEQIVQVTQDCFQFCCAHLSIIDMYFHIIDPVIYLEKIFRLL